jgi:hypothetical protein
MTSGSDGERGTPCNDAMEWIMVSYLPSKKGNGELLYDYYLFIFITRKRVKALVAKYIIFFPIISSLFPTTKFYSRESFVE